MWTIKYIKKNENESLTFFISSHDDGLFICLIIRREYVILEAITKIMPEPGLTNFDRFSV